MILRIQSFFEQFAFGVCEWWGRRLGIRTSKVRLFFIYLSFVTFGSPLILYFVMVFILEHKHSFRFKKKRKTIWDL